MLPILRKDNLNLAYQAKHLQYTLFSRFKSPYLISCNIKPCIRMTNREFLDIMFGGDQNTKLDFYLTYDVQFPITENANCSKCKEFCKNQTL